MTLTDLQSERLGHALAALREAGTEKLHGRLQDAFEAAPKSIPDVLAQARSWASIRAEDEPLRAAARDAVGLLWAAMEDGL